MKAYLQTLIMLLACVRLCSKTTQPDITYTHNGRRCVKCAPGTLLISHCVKENEVARCQLCPNGTYSSEYNIATSCAPCKQTCEHKDLVPVTNCTKLTNMECACPKGTFNVNAHLDLFHAKCMVYGSCGPGYGVKFQATSVQNTTCEKCELGKTFSLTTSALDKCQPCTNCGQFGVKVECNRTHNRICDVQPNGIPVSNPHREKDTISYYLIGGIIGGIIIGGVIGGIIVKVMYQKRV